MANEHERFYPPVAVGEETHIFGTGQRVDLATWAIMTGAQHLEMTTAGAELPPLLPGVEEAVQRQAEADHAAREAAARASLTERVRERMQLACEGHRGVTPAPAGLQRHLFETAATAAVEVFLGVLKDPPTFVTQPDGHAEIEWPKPAAGEHDD